MCTSVHRADGRPVDYAVVDHDDIGAGDDEPGPDDFLAEVGPCTDDACRAIREAAAPLGGLKPHEADLVAQLVALDVVALDYAVRVSPYVAEVFAQQAEGANRATPERVLGLVRAANGLVPGMHAPGTPNDGRVHHSWRVGREKSRVLYLDVVGAYLNLAVGGLDALTGTLERVGQDAGCDEVKTTMDGLGGFTVRYWWD